MVLLHGLGRSYQSMITMQEALSEQGYHTVNIDYPSTDKSIETIAKNYVPKGINECSRLESTSTHFVTHSLGGILLRKALSENRPVNLGRVVMLSPPNQGSQLVDKIRNWKLFQWIMGPAGQQLSTDPSSIPNQLGPVDYPVGIITGNRHSFFDSWFAWLIPGVDDGKVSTKNAKVDGMQDFLVVNESHPFIMNSKYVIMETTFFLSKGSFTHKEMVQPEAKGEDWYSTSTQ